MSYSSYGRLTLGPVPAFEPGDKVTLIERLKTAFSGGHDHWSTTLDDSGYVLVVNAGPNAQSADWSELLEGGGVVELSDSTKRDPK